MSALGPPGRIEGLKQTIRRIETLREPWRSRGPRNGEEVRAPAAEAPLMGFGFEALDQVFAGGGLVAGSHQMTAPAGQEASAAAFALALLSRRLDAAPRGSALLIQAEDVLAEEGELEAEGLRAFGLDLDRVGLLRARNAQAAVQAADEALKSGAAAAVVLDAGPRARFDLSLTRRFNLAAQRRGALALLVGGAPEATSAALTRWRVFAAPSCGRPLKGARPVLGPPAFGLVLTRNRLGALGQWDVEWDCDARIFRPAPSALPASVAPLVRGRAGATDGRGDVAWTLGAGRKAG